MTLDHGVRQHYQDGSVDLLAYGTSLVGVRARCSAMMRGNLRALEVTFPGRSGRVIYRRKGTPPPITPPPSADRFVETMLAASVGGQTARVDFMIDAYADAARATATGPHS